MKFFDIFEGTHLCCVSRVRGLVSRECTLTVLCLAMDWSYVSLEGEVKSCDVKPADHKIASVWEFAKARSFLRTVRLHYKSDRFAVIDA